MFDVKPGPWKGSECLMLSVGRVRVSDGKPGPREGSERLMLNSFPNGRKHKNAAKWLHFQLPLGQKSPFSEPLESPEKFIPKREKSRKARKWLRFQLPLGHHLNHSLAKGADKIFSWHTKSATWLQGLLMQQTFGLLSHASLH